MDKNRIIALTVTCIIALLLMVLMMVVQQISSLFELVKDLFGL